MATNQARTALLEWVAVGVLIVGCGVATAGVMTLVADAGLAFLLIGIGAVVALLGAVVWTVVVKTRDPSPRSAKREF